MERIRLYAILLCAVLILGGLLGGCGGKNTLPDYRDYAFRARVSWNVGELGMEAVAVSDLQGSLRIELTEPKELSGLVLLLEGERRSVLCADTEVDGAGMAPLFETVELLLPVGERDVICQTEWEGESVMYAETEEKGVELYLDPHSGAPVGVVRGDTTVRVLSFEFFSLKEETR